MISEKTIKKMMGKPMPNMLRDTDKDKVIDIMDCQPRNPKKQGFRHTIARTVAKIIPGKERKERAQEFITKRETEFDEDREVRHKIRREEKLKSVEFEERERGRKRREYVKSGGFVGSVSRGLSNVAKNLPKSVPMTTTRKQKSKGKKGKKGKRSTTRTKRTTPSVPNISEFKLNY